MTGGRKRVRRSNYDQHAGQPRPASNKHPRAEINARKAWVFENWCKQQRLSAVLNLGSGQGGDALKIAKIVPPGSTIVNVDFSEPALTEFQMRVSAVAALKNHDWIFACEDVLSYELPSELFARTDVICCMLALHYFADTQAALTQFFQLVYDALAPGGVFVAVFPDAQVIKRHILNAKPVTEISAEYEDEVFNIDVRVQDQDELRSGRAEAVPYNFTLEGTMTRVPESMLPESVLISALAATRLTLCESINLADIDAPEIRRCMGLHGRVSPAAESLLRLYRAIRVTK